MILQNMYCIICKVYLIQAKQADHSYHSGGSGGEQPPGIYILPSFHLRS